MPCGYHVRIAIAKFVKAVLPKLNPPVGLGRIMCEPLTKLGLDETITFPAHKHEHAVHSVRYV